MRRKILIIDDEIDICTSLTFALEDKYDVKSTINPKEGLNMLIKESYNLVLLDLKIGMVDGINVLKEIKNLDKSIQVIIMTAYGSIMSSVDAIKKGAYTYLTKPLDLNILEDSITQALEYQRNNEKVKYVENTLGDENSYNGIIGKSPAMKNVFHMIEKLKDVDTSVVVTGESGTGKELVARAIHYSGKRKDGNFVEINCAAIPEGLLEEELFGHKKGTFTGALSDKQGKFEYANNGTIFLDEIGDMPFKLQSKLLRVLQQKRYTPLGSNIPVELNVRVVAATNRDLKKLVEEGRFRGDLYFRLNVFEIILPPLRDRVQDLPLLSNHFIDIYNNSMNKNVIGLSKKAEDCLLNYNYPGNIRELSNIIECAVLLAKDDVIETENLPVEVQNRKININDELDLNMGTSIGTESLVGLTLQEAEKKLIKAALELNNGHKKATATMLGISERGLRYKINEYGLN
ncbi:two-component system response regulator AtoC [Sedimentibacter acidaminivorans]|uniref:Two-component system response regulator AtoC n=1 Tax=Sedimentibacter acidaminivorans TaxID=913099 RepID=A0ABS4G9T9_9FIRM|nr:sigma-54 dependent transcriptional regulator [Sedimentibacter acidaminivorans]MBP1924451.1 two-component system response regulator AtoC [Sedimentibacter acidaminivorans]